MFGRFEKYELNQIKPNPRGLKSDSNKLSALLEVEFDRFDLT